MIIKKVNYNLCYTRIRLVKVKSQIEIIITATSLKII